MKYTRLFLIPILSVLVLSSCSKDTQVEVEEQVDLPCVYENEDSLGEKVTRINGFESNRDLDSMMPLNYLGKVELDSSIKHSGNYSAKVTLFNQHLEDSDIGNPTICQSLFNTSRQVDETDVGNTNFVKMSVYNAQDEDYRIGMRPIIISTYDWIGGPVLPTKWITVKANSWTEMCYQINLSIIPEVSVSSRGEEQSKLIHYLPAMYIVFLRPQQEETDRVFYLDDFCVEKF